MTDTTTSAPAAPAWLAAAKADLVNAQAADLVSRRRRAGNHAARINAKLNELGITPEYPAEPTPAGTILPALLISPDPEAAYNGVHATFREDPEGGDVVLLVEDWEDSRDVRQGPILHSVGDVAAVLTELPAPPPAPRPDFQAQALRSINGLRVDHVSADSAAVAEAINGLTAAVLHLADVTARSNDRPGPSDRVRCASLAAAPPPARHPPDNPKGPAMATAAVLVWRLAHPTLTVTTPTGTVPAGPYTAPVAALLDQYGDEDAVYELLGMRDVHGHDMHHLAPDQDPALDAIDPGEVCGFDSPAALRAWLGGHMPALAACGFTVRCYRVPAVRRGSGGQVVFRWAAAREHNAPTAHTTTPEEGTR